jgi:Zn-dependent protease with chaperone function
MPFLLLLFLTLACLPNEWPAPLLDRPPDEWSPARSAASTWLAVGLVVGFARLVAARAARQLAAAPGRRERVLRRYARLRTYHIFLLLGVYAASLYVLGWGWAVQHYCGEGRAMLPGAELLILAPFMAGLVLSWVAFYDAERALHDAAEAEAEAPEPYWSRGAYVGFHVRQNLALVFAPLLLLLMMKWLQRLFPESEEGLATWLTTAGGFAVSLSIIVGLPLLLRLALSLKPMPPGPMRARLEAAARRLRFRCSNILVWNTRAGVANAMVAGVVPWVRYVILTDRLMTDLTPDEVEAVFGHEIGHTKHYHMLYYLGFLAVSLLLVGALWVRVASYLPFFDHAEAEHADATFQMVPLVTMVGPAAWTSCRTCSPTRRWSAASRGAWPW